MFRLVSLMIGLVLITGCALVRPVLTQTDTVTITEIRRDTVIKTKADAALIDAYLSCDSLNRVVMSRVMEKEGELIELQWVLDSITSDTVYQVLRVVATVPQQFDTISWIERYIKNNTVTSQTTAPEIEEPPWWLKGLVLTCITIVVTSLILLIKKIAK